MGEPQMTVSQSASLASTNVSFAGSIFQNE